MMNFSLFFLIWGAAAGALNATRHEIAAHVDYAASYQIGFNTLASFAQNAQGLAKTEFMIFFDPGVLNSADTSVLSKPVELKDIEPTFKRIYEAAKSGQVKAACTFLLNLKRVPLYLGLSALKNEEWESFRSSQKKKACETIADSSAMSDLKKRQEILSFLCVCYYVNQTNNSESFDSLEARRGVLTGQIKKYLATQLQFQKFLSSYTLSQIASPLIYGPLAAFLGVMALVYQDNASVKWGCGISAGVLTIMGLCATFIFNVTKFLYEQRCQWESITNEFFLQQTAELIAAFFVVLDYKQQNKEIFVGQECVENAINDRYSFTSRLRRTLPVRFLGHIADEQLSLERLAINYKRQN